MAYRLEDTFGLSRVIEPKNSVPVTAWKIDNNMEISPGECLVKLKSIHLERDSFQQFCNDAGFDEGKIRAKILDMIHRRGKLHNPFTNSGGMFFGTIEKMGEDYARGSKYKEGDDIIGLVTITALPMKLSRITKIDYHYGEIRVEGHCIIFRDSPISQLMPGLELNYTMAALDEAGSLFTIYKMAQKDDRYLIIGKDIICTLIYGECIRKALGEQCHILTVLDVDAVGGLSEDEVESALMGTVDRVFIRDISNPIQIYNEIMGLDLGPVDFTIESEDMRGAEVLGILLTRDQGGIYFTSVKNNYSQTVLIAESLGKEVETFSVDQYDESYEEFTVSLLRGMKEKLTTVNRMYEKLGSGQRLAEKKESIYSAEKAGKVEDFIYASPVTEALLEETINIADFDCNVIIQGETGVGKEKILEVIHKNSSRNGEACVKINCATIPENLAESEFFGYEEGAFTGARAAGKKGYFEMANKGILFLDEIGQLPMAMQSKLLRVLQENRFYKVGGINPIDVDVRVICANNVSLRKLVEDGHFREDLYYRLNICTIEVPPLSQRPEDVVVLAKSFAEKYCLQYGVDKELQADAAIFLAKQHWQGNVRELENLVHRAVINVKGHLITARDLEMIMSGSLLDSLVIDVRKDMQREGRLDFNEIVAKQEATLIRYAMEKGGSTRKAAEMLNMTQAQLMRKKQKYEI